MCLHVLLGHMHVWSRHKACRFGVLQLLLPLVLLLSPLAPVAVSEPEPVEERLRRVPIQQPQNVRHGQECGMLGGDENTAAVKEEVPAATGTRRLRQFALASGQSGILRKIDSSRNDWIGYSRVRPRPNGSFRWVTNCGGAWADGSNWADGVVPTAENCTSVDVSALSECIPAGRITGVCADLPHADLVTSGGALELVGQLRVLSWTHVATSGRMVLRCAAHSDCCSAPSPALRCVKRAVLEGETELDGASLMVEDGGFLSVASSLYAYSRVGGCANSLENVTQLVADRGVIEIQSGVDLYLSRGPNYPTSNPTFEPFLLAHSAEQRLVGAFAGVFGGVVLVASKMIFVTELFPESSEESSDTSSVLIGGRLMRVAASIVFGVVLVLIGLSVVTLFIVGFVLGRAKDRARSALREAEAATARIAEDAAVLLEEDDFEQWSGGGLPAGSGDELGSAVEDARHSSIGEDDEDAEHNEGGQKGVDATQPLRVLEDSVMQRSPSAVDLLESRPHSAEGIFEAERAFEGFDYWGGEK